MEREKLEKFTDRIMFEILPVENEFWRFYPPRQGFQSLRFYRWKMNSGDFIN